MSAPPAAQGAYTARIVPLVAFGLKPQAASIAFSLKTPPPKEQSTP